MSEIKPAVLVVGAGMYVCGKGTAGYGTLLPTLAQDQSEGKIGVIHVAATTSASVALASRKLTQINKRLGISADVRFWPKKGKNPFAYRQVLSRLNGVGCAVVSVPDHLHARIAGDLIQAGLHTLVVKPFTPTVSEAQKLIRLARQKNIYGAVELHKRFDESNLLMRQAIQDGRLGDLLYFLVEFSQRRSIQDVFGAWRDKTNVFQYLGVHYADLIYFATGALPVRAMAMGQKGSRGGEWDAIEVVVDWKHPKSAKQFTSIIVTNWIDPDTTTAMSDQKILAVGSLGRYQADQKNRGVQLITEAGIEEINPYFSQTYKTAAGHMEIRGYGPASVRQFLSDVRDLEGGRISRADLVLNRPSFEQSLVSTAVIECAAKSLKRGNEWIPIAPSLFQDLFEDKSDG